MVDTDSFLKNVAKFDPEEQSSLKNHAGGTQYTYDASKVTLISIHLTYVPFVKMIVIPGHIGSSIVPCLPHAEQCGRNFGIMKL